MVCFLLCISICLFTVKLITLVFHECFRYLLVNPRDRRVVICESLLCSTVWRNAVAKVLFKHFEVKNNYESSLMMAKKKQIFCSLRGTLIIMFLLLFLLLFSVVTHNVHGDISTYCYEPW